MKSNNQIDYQYLGDTEFQPSREGYEDKNGNVFFPYRPDPELIETINLAIALERPLLLEGEPGCGKTCLAGAIAYEYTRRYLENDPVKDSQEKVRFWPYYIWNVKSSTQYRDGLYKFDAVLRLRDAQMLGADPEKLKEYLPDDEFDRMKTRLGDTERYVKYGQLGEALREKKGDDAWMNDYRPIVLIDEIDKADSDFANDLLRELDNFNFDILELEEKEQKRSKAKQKPIIIITSNREHPLPEPFLRRCLYYYLPFPTARISEIIELRFGKITLNSETDIIVQKALERFEDIQQFLDDEPGRRSPGLSEFLDFLRMLLDVKSNADAIKILENFSVQTSALGTLLKSHDLIHRFKEWHEDD